MHLGDWLATQIDLFRAQNDQQRLRMASCCSEGYEARESDPDLAYALFAEGRRLAELLDEPWWVLFYRNELVEALLHFKRDFRDVLEMAVGCALEVRKPTNQSFPGRFATWDSLIAAYIGIDAEGYAPRIREAIDHLDREVTREHDGSRYLLMARERIFALERNDLDAAFKSCMSELDLCSSDRTQSRAIHFGAFIFCSLCHIAGLQDQIDRLAEWANVAEELAKANGHLCEQSEAVAWQAVVAQQSGDIALAKRLCRNAVTLAARIKMPPKRGYFDALTGYHLLRDDLEGALAIRDAELASITQRGRLLYETRVRINRCQLLSQLGRLTPDEISQTQQAARKLRQPAPYLQALENLAD